MVAMAFANETMMFLDIEKIILNFDVLYNIIPHTANASYFFRPQIGYKNYIARGRYMHETLVHIIAPRGSWIQWSWQDELIRTRGRG